MSDYSGDSQRREMIERESQRREWERQQYIESLEEQIEVLKRKLKKYEEGDQK
jgi:hypothetical protein